MHTQIHHLKSSLMFNCCCSQLSYISHSEILISLHISFFKKAPKRLLQLIIIVVVVVVVVVISNTPRGGAMYLQIIERK